MQCDAATAIYFNGSMRSPLPAQTDAHHRAMLHEIEAIFAEAPVLAVIHSKCAITDHGAKRRAKTIDVEAIGREGLPGEVAPDAKTADIARQYKLGS